jgi:hypothetical protein
MALTKVGTGSTNDIPDESTNNVNLTYPTGIAAGDIAIVAGSWFEGTGLGRTFTGPAAGYTSALSHPIGGTIPSDSESRVHVYYRILDGSETGGGTLNVAWSGNCFATAWIDVFRGSSALSFVSATGGSIANDDECTLPSVTASSTQGLIAVIGTGDPSTFTTPGGWTAGQLGDQATNTGGNFFRTGPHTGTTAVTMSNVRDNGAIVILVDGAAAGGGGSTVKQFGLLGVG